MIGNTVSVVKARYSHIESVCELFDSLSERDTELTALCYDRKRLNVLNALERGDGWIAVRNGSAVGILAFCQYPDCEYTLLDEIVLDPKFRGMGIGSELIGRFHSAFPCKTLAMTHAENFKMMDILRGYGYRKLMENPYQETVTWIRL